MSDSELTLRENLVFRNILSFFRACPQQHVSSLCSIEINRFAIWFSLYRTHVILQISVLLKFTNNIKGKILLFHWRGGYLTREVLAELFEIFEKEAQAKDKKARVSVNWAQAVLRVRFEDGAGEEQIEMEEANEGEKG